MYFNTTNNLLLTDLFPRRLSSLSIGYQDRDYGHEFEDSVVGVLLLLLLLLLMMMMMMMMMRYARSGG